MQLRLWQGAALQPDERLMFFIGVLACQRFEDSDTICLRHGEFRHLSQADFWAQCCLWFLLWRLCRTSTTAWTCGVRFFLAPYRGDFARLDFGVLLGVFWAGAPLANAGTCKPGRETMGLRSRTHRSLESWAHLHNETWAVHLHAEDAG